MTKIMYYDIQVEFLLNENPVTRDSLSQAPLPPACRPVGTRRRPDVRSARG